MNVCLQISRNAIDIQPKELPRSIITTQFFWTIKIFARRIMTHCVHTYLLLACDVQAILYSK